jgi:ABC-type nitrate/sulfonate/bicarbonate transport system substrate-binding protein
VCNADALQDEGTAATALGKSDAALKKYDAALRCRFDSHSLALAFMAACRADKVDFARKYWKRMNADEKTHYLQMCLHNHITQEQLDE